MLLDYCMDFLEIVLQDHFVLPVPESVLPLMPELESS